MLRPTIRHHFLTLGFGPRFGPRFGSRFGSSSNRCLSYNFV